MGQVTIVCGTANSSRTEQIDSLWRKHGDKAILLTPTERLARTRQSLLVREQRLPGLFGKRAWELTAFARVLVEASGQQVHMLSMLERRLMVHQALVLLPPETAAQCPAITPGLVRHLLQIITELKQAAIEPEAFHNAIVHSRHAGVFDRVVAAAYDRYQASLVKAGQYDVPGLYWEAEHCCNEENFSLPDNADIILLDGFDDFTLSQQRFLEALSARVEQIVIGLHYDPEPGRRDLFQLQRRWVEKYTARIAAETKTCASGQPRDYIRHIAQHLFWRDPPPSPAGLIANVRLMPCSDVQHEIETVARQIKQLLIQKKTPPRQIAFCLSDVENHIGALRTIFDGFGVPLALRIYPTLRATALGAFVMRLFDVLDRWEHRTVTSLLASPLLGASPEEEPLIRAFPLFSRQLGILMGQQEFRDRLRNTKTPKAFPKASVNYEDTRRLFEERFDKLQALAKALPEKALINTFATVLDQQINTLLSPGTMDKQGNNGLETAALRALHSLLEQFAGTAHLDITLCRKEFVRILEEAMSETRVQARSETGPGVCCCKLEALRHDQFDHVFLGGLNEGMLPRPATINAVYSEADRHRLGQMKLELPGQYEHTCRERLLFSHAINAAQQELVLSWRRQDTKGRDALPSPFVVELQDMFENHDIDITLAEPGPDCFIPEPMQAASKKDLANVSYYHDWKPLLAPLPEITKSTGPVVTIESRRNSTEPFDAYDGCITTPDLIAALAATYGADKQFSISRLEKYLRFPFAFFMEEILKIQETEMPENELDPRTRGSILHDALYRFHRQYADISVKNLLAEAVEEVRHYMTQCVQDAFDANTKALAAVPDVVLRIEQRRIEDALQRYLTRMAEDFDDTLVPSHFEVVFGRAPRDDADGLHTTEPFALDLDGNKVLLTGKIDRIDTGDETARILDYKTSGTPSPKQIKAGLDLQLSVYAWAVEQHLLPETTCSEAWYYPIFGDKMRDALLRNKKADFSERETNVKEQIANAVHGIRSGYFPPAPDPALAANEVRASTASRYEAWRIERKNMEKET